MITFLQLKILSRSVAFSFAILFLLSSANIVSAQLGPGTDSVLVELSSTFPKPDEQIRVKLTSYATDLDRAKIFYSINGKVMSSGAGLKNFSFRMGALGVPTTLGVVVDSPTIGRFEKNITINPADVDILWQATDSYTPPFYKGKASPARMSKIRAVAIPNMKTPSGARVKGDALVYQWRLDDKPQLEKSGLAKNFIDFGLDYVSEDKTILVNASSINEAGLIAQSVTFFATVDPQIIFYEDRPIEGITYETALGGMLTLKNEEATLLAEPYFFSATQKIKRYLSFVWAVGGNIVNSTVSDPSELTLKAPKDVSGESTISIDVKNDKKLLQQGSAGLTIKFGSQ